MGLSADKDEADPCKREAVAKLSDDRQVLCDDETFLAYLRMSLRWDTDAHRHSESVARPCRSVAVARWTSAAVGGLDQNENSGAAG